MLCTYGPGYTSINRSYINVALLLEPVNINTLICFLQATDRTEAANNLVGSSVFLFSCGKYINFQLIWDGILVV